MKISLMNKIFYRFYPDESRVIISALVRFRSSDYKEFGEIHPISYEKLSKLILSSFPASYLQLYNAN